MCISPNPNAKTNPNSPLLVRRWATRISAPASSIRSVQLVALLLLMVHWFACVLSLQTTFAADPRDTWLGRFGHCWRDEGAEQTVCSAPGVIWLQ